MDNLENIEFGSEFGVLDVRTRRLSYGLRVCEYERRVHILKSVFGTVAFAISTNAGFGHPNVEFRD